MEGKIGVFDSGIGGVTVIKKILKVLPKEDYIYYSDSKNIPYGDKTDKEIKELCDDIVKILLDKNCKIIVIACNTATARAVEYLRDKYKNIIFIAIEPAYKMVYDYAYEDNTLILATEGTIKSERFNLLYEKYNNNKTELLKCKGLADIIENSSNEKLIEYLEKILSKYKGKVKNVVLGCTHYPIIKNDIKNILGEQINFFEGSEKLALHLKRVLEKNNMLENNTGKIEFIDSQDSKEKKERFFEILNKNID